MSEYQKWDELPWYQRAGMSIVSGMERLQKAALGMVGMEDAAQSSFTNERNRMKMQLKQQGSTDGLSLGGLWEGSQVYKLGDALFGDENKKLSETTGTSLQSGGGVTGGGEDMLKISGGSPSRMGASQGEESLGRALAVEEEPALEQDNYNYNNFSF